MNGTGPNIDQQQCLLVTRAAEPSRPTATGGASSSRTSWDDGQTADTFDGRTTSAQTCGGGTERPCSLVVPYLAPPCFVIAFAAVMTCTAAQFSAASSVCSQPEAEFLCRHL